MEKLDIESFWLRINSLIKEYGYTQNSLTDKCGFTPRAIANWSTRKMIPDAFSVYLIAKELNTTVEYLLTGKQPHTQNYERLQADLNELLQKYK